MNLEDNTKYMGLEETERTTLKSVDPLITNKILPLDGEAKDF